MSRLLHNFKRNINNITKYYEKLIDRTQHNQTVDSISKWIVDNYYIINEQEKFVEDEHRNKFIKQIEEKRKLELYYLIYNDLRENDFCINLTSLFKKLNMYQKEANDYFSYYEINLMNVLIREALITELNDLSKRLNFRLTEKDNIEETFDNIRKDMLSNTKINFSNYLKINNNIVNHPYYVEQLNYELKEMGDLSKDVFLELNEVLQRNKISLKEIIKESRDRTAKDNILIINLFASFKEVARYKIEYLYRNISYTEKALINEKVNIYDQMYDSTKNDYRGEIIKNAKKRRISEFDYAFELINKANREEKHVGWYLFKKKNYKRRTSIYISSIVGITILLSFILAYFLGPVLFFILLIPVSSLVIDIINQILQKVTKTRSVFKMKFENGLPKEESTMVVIPTMVKDKEKILRMFVNLETYYLSNKTNNIYFTLLGDCSSEETRDVERDQEIVETGLNKVKELNEKYGKKIFYFIYRNRIYSKSEECYLGYERKRGGLTHFNLLLLNKLSKDQKREYFKCQTFDGFNVPIKYVITVDEDTKLLLNAALKFVGAMAHPMNSPVISEDGKRVVSGYGIMQPRIGIDVEVTNRSKYSQLFAGLGGLDTYVTASFDLYQDVFGEGSFVGKGIYDLAVFEKVLDNVFPNNLILSHDLIEGSYLRCGFINDVELLDSYPASYLNDAARHHRWNRGDWQIMGWLKKKVKNIKNVLVDNPISTLSKWKIFDNLRRSLVSICLLLILFYGFANNTQNILVYVLLVFVITATPIFFYIINRILYRHKYDIFLKYYLDLIRGISAVINRSLVALAVLPYEAYLYLDSIIRSLYRLYISKKKLLNWITAEEMEKLSKKNLETYIKRFMVNYVAAILLIILCLIYRPSNFIIASILALVWFLAPIVMYLMSKSIPSKENSLNSEERAELEELATRTWKYFEAFLKEEYNYLIPDNYQFNREKQVDYKTSPTNIGFSLVSIVSACELNIISIKTANELITDVIKSVEKLKKWNGHLYNWYNVFTLKEIYPFFISSVDSGNFMASLYVVKGFIEKNGNRDVLNRVTKLIHDMNFNKLYNQQFDVFSIGYNVSEQTLLLSNYDGFASESRLTSYIAISKGDVPYKHWFLLDRTLTKYRYYKGVASWAGSAFEYFMPLIFMKTYPHTLLDETYYFAYYAQREFMRGINNDLPWGISESAYNQLDDSESYKYKTFGIPYLKFRDTVVYPIIISSYSSIMAISIDDREVYNNILKFKKLDMYGKYGLYESYDNEDKVIIKNYYAHHQGMILASLTNYLKDNIIQEYFSSDINIKANEMLLKEKVQIRTYIDLKMNRYKKYLFNEEHQENDAREYNKLNKIPEMGVLSNGFYTIVINERGIGFSKYKNLQINRYREIANEDYGIFLYVRNLNNDKLWTNTYAPIDTKNNKYKVVFASDRIKYIREDNGILTTTEITVVKDHNAELRKVTFQNNTDEDVTLEVTSYGEVIMCRKEEDIAHRAFNNLTINSEVDEETSSLIFTRRSNTKDDTKYFIIHRIFSDKELKYPFEYETSRTNFIGRNRDISNPEVIMDKKNLSKFMGVSLDPIMSIRKQIKIKAQSKEKLYMLVGFGKSREQVMEIVNTYKDEISVNNAFEMATVLNNMSISYAKLEGHQIRLYNNLLKYLFEAIPITNWRKGLLDANTLAQPSLWKYGISGDLPIILVEIDKIEDIEFIREILKAYEFYKSRALTIDIVIINNEDPRKEQMILNDINNIMYQINILNYTDTVPGNVYIISSSNISKEEKILLNTVARIYFNASSPISFEKQIIELDNSISTIGSITNKYIENIEAHKENMTLYNGFGGFLNNGSEYQITRTDTPTPWSNIIANPNFGSIITNNLGGFSYAYNSREYKLTSWSNDITGDPSSEVIVINNHRFRPSSVKHNFGYTIFESITTDYNASIKVFVGNDKIKFYEITVTNNLSAEQSLKFDFLLRMVLGVTEEQTNRYLLSSFDSNSNRLYIKNNYTNNFKDTKVFISSTETITSYYDKDLNTKGITVNINLGKEETKIFSFMLGCETNDEIINKYSDINSIEKEFNNVISSWDNKLSTIQVNTPDETFNYVMNGWYLYQTYASRLLARAGFYQVGGAIGFRDQLQDIMSIIYSDSNYARNQILLHAKHQFKEGDVLHWWHEETMLGSRTKFSDDYLWLVYVTFEYLKLTGDYSILDERVPFIEGDKLRESENEYEYEKGINYYYLDDNDTLYNHLKLCINKALDQIGRHGLPLMGSGDWNDGMNRVGHRGKGESVFVGFFLYDLLIKMMHISKKYDDYDYAKMCINRSEELKTNINTNAWDGEWYLRAYYDNGDLLGSRNNAECQIDLLCQSWSVLSNVADKSRKESLFKSVEERLVDKNNKIIKLLTPGFEDTTNSPGYIRNYNVGLRENGGQYTHAALWYILALLKENKIDDAYEYYQMINPINRSLQMEDVLKYKVEPYVIAADIYANPKQLGRGGWTWYTGSSNWAYKIGLEEILGFKKFGNTLTINPKIKSSWDSYEITYKYMNTKYNIKVNNKDHITSGIVEVKLDGKKLKEGIIGLIDDRVDHLVEVEMKEDL